MENERLDLIYRDLNAVEHWMAEAQHGRFTVERLPFYLAGIPTYVVVGELALCRVLIGTFRNLTSRRRLGKRHRLGGVTQRA